MRSCWIYINIYIYIYIYILEAYIISSESEGFAPAAGPFCYLLVVSMGTAELAG